MKRSKRYEKRIKMKKKEDQASRRTTIFTNWEDAKARKWISLRGRGRRGRRSRMGILIE